MLKTKQTIQPWLYNQSMTKTNQMRSWNLILCWWYSALYTDDLINWVYIPLIWLSLHTFGENLLLLILLLTVPGYSGSHCNQGQWAPVDTQTPFKISLGEMVKCLIYYMIIDLTSPNMFSPTTQQWECLYLFSSANGSNNWKGRKLFYSLLIILPEIYFHNNSIYSGS